MKVIFAMVLFLFFSAGTSAWTKPGSHLCIPDRTEISCVRELALVCGLDYKDGCLTGESSVHRCMLQPMGADCNVPTQILCIPGFRDGCETGRTTRHQCVPFEGPACDSGESFTCPKGFHDACNRY